MHQSPQSFNYQAVTWDNAGELMKSTDLTLRISIFSESETGPLQWEETHSATTNEFGLFTLQIGAGTRTNGLATNFSEIIWGLASHFLKVEVDAGSGEAMKEQQKMIEELQKENEELAQLKHEIEELKMSLGLLSRKE